MPSDHQLKQLGSVFQLMAFRPSQYKETAAVIWDMCIAPNPGSWAGCDCLHSFLRLGLLKLNAAGDGYDERVQDGQLLTDDLNDLLPKE